MKPTSERPARSASGAPASSRQRSGARGATPKVGSAFITRLDARGSGPRVAVKDIIDMEGVVTTVGCRALADGAEPATQDAPCLDGTRAASARIVGKANLHELAFGGTGINPWFGTPVNPLDPTRMPGGSSSGCAVAVATGEADVAFGTDTAGSVRTPSACCGTVGLKTTHGRVSCDGVWPLAPSLDSVGPMGATVAAVAAGMALLEPGFAIARAPAPTIGRLRLPGTDPVIDAAIDRALAAAEVDTIDIDLTGWDEADAAARVVLFAEAWASDAHLVAARPDGLGADVLERLRTGAAIPADEHLEALATRDPWRAELAAMFRRVAVIALPTLRTFPPPLDATEIDSRYTNAAINLAGHPSLALPVPSGDALPASVQLLGPDGSEALLLATGALLEAAVTTVRGWRASG